MRAQFLLPRLFRPIGYVLAIPGFILGYLVVYQNYAIPGFGFKMRSESNIFQKTFENFTNELSLTMVILGLLFVAFAKIKKEDELTGRLRLNALYWGVLANFVGYTCFIVLSWTNMLYHTAAVDLLMDKASNDLQFTIFNFFLPLLIFILRFNYLLYKSDSEFDNRELKLLPNRPFNILGKVLSVILIILTLINSLADGISIIDQSLFVLPLALLLWSYAKEKKEDEYVRSLRLNAMQLAVYVNYTILLLSNLLVYGISFWIIQLVNLVTIPLIFQISFQYRSYRLRKESIRSGTLSFL